MHAQLIHFLWKCVGNLVKFCRPLTGHLGLILTGHMF